MRRPNARLIAFFALSVIAGYGISFAIMSVLGVDLETYGFGTLTLVALLAACILVIIFDTPFNLRTFEWPEEKEKPEPSVRSSAQAGAAAPPAQVPSIGEGPQAPGDADMRFHFPHEAQSEHWDVDFGDSKETYEGAELPMWLLAGWAAFIIWAVVYLIAGLRFA